MIDLGELMRNETLRNVVAYMVKESTTTIQRNQAGQRLWVPVDNRTNTVLKGLWEQIGEWHSND